MVPIDHHGLMTLAGKSIWGKSAEEAVAHTQRVIAQVMHLADVDEIQALALDAGDDVLRDVIRHAEAGQFDERSWAYWHYPLGLAERERVPPLPRRTFC